MGVKVQARVESALQAPAKVAPAQPACIDREAVWERPVSSWSDAERFEELQKKYFGDKVLPSKGAEFIREAREARDAQLEGIA